MFLSLIQIALLHISELFINFQHSGCMYINTSVEILYFSLVIAPTLWNSDLVQFKVSLMSLSIAVS